MGEKRVVLDLDLVWSAGPEPRQAIDSGLFALLQAIRETGKLTKAAAQTGLPYRQAWGLVAKWSQIIGRPLVTKEQGRGTRLTPLGERLLWLRERIGARLSPHLESAVSEAEQQLLGLLDEHQTALSLYASHDLALTELRDFLRSQPGPTLDVRFVGSVESVAALCNSRCDMAGFHVPEGTFGSAILRVYQPWLKPRLQRLIQFVKRRQGLIVAPGNPKGIRDVADIARTQARFINRQRGSGTRLALEKILGDQGIDPQTIAGYHAEEFTHVAVAAAIASGMADVGVAVEAAARRLRLSFIPLFTENYYLLVKQEALEQQDVKAVIAVLKSEAFQRIADALPGYDASGAGTIRLIADLG